MEPENKLLLKWVPRHSVKPYARNSRKNEETAEVVARSIREYGWQQPIVVDKNSVIVVGHSRWHAAELLGMTEVPVVEFTGTEQEAKEYRIADNRIQETSKWDYDILKTELVDLDLDTGFTEEEIDKILGDKTFSMIEKAEPTVFEVIVEFTDELEQRVLYNQLTEEGLVCRLLSI